MNATNHDIRLLANALSRRARSGRAVYTRDETTHVLTFLVVAGVVDPSVIPQSGRDEVARVFAEALIENTDDDGEIGAKLGRYYTRHPPNRALLQEIVAGLSAMTEQEQTARLESAARALSGEKLVDWHRFLNDSQSTGIRSSPLSQFMLAREIRKK